MLDTTQFRLVHFFCLQEQSLNGDGQQFHQYQQNEQPPLTLYH